MFEKKVKEFLTYFLCCNHRKYVIKTGTQRLVQT